MTKTRDKVNNLGGAKVSKGEWITDGTWSQYCSAYNTLKDGYTHKLHVAVDISNSDQILPLIEPILIEAADLGIISYKKINFSKQEMKESIKRSEERIKNATKDDFDKSIRTLAQKKRLYNNQITIYLSDPPNIAAVAKLCQNIEEKLRDFKRMSQHLSIADVPISPHISIRQEKLNGREVVVQTASEKELTSLRAQVKKSNTYKQLSKAMQQQTDNYNPCALLDVDETLILKRPEAHINEALLQTLIKSGIRDVYLFTNMSIDEVENVGRKKVEGERKRVLRYDLVEHMQKMGFNVHGVITQADVDYNKGPGKAYEDFYLKAYHLKKNNPNNAKYDEIKADHFTHHNNIEKHIETDHAASNTTNSPDQNAAPQKAAMFDYFRQHSNFKYLFYIDDHNECLQKVAMKNMAHENKADILFCGHMPKLEERTPTKDELKKQNMDNVNIIKKDLLIFHEAIFHDKLQELTAIIQFYEAILCDTPQTESKSSTFSRNKHFSDEQLKEIAALKDKVIDIIASMSLAERNREEIKELIKPSKNGEAPNLIDFHRSRLSIFATGKTSTRKNIEELYRKNTPEELLLKTMPRSL